MASEDREYDITVFGASGFTGQFVVREVAKNNSKRKLKWAVAGRSKDKLEQVLRETAQELGRDLTHEANILIVDCNDVESINSMCARSRLILNCVGPYRFYGEVVVKAAVENKCHHLDISGEPEYLENMQLKYHDQAVQNNVHVVGTCGFDSIPADMGTVFAIEQFPGKLCHLESFMAIDAPKGFVGHYGTYHSIIYGIASNFEGNLKRIRRQLFPTRQPTFGPKLKKRGAVFHSQEVNKWCMPFMGSDASVVRRSQRYRSSVAEKDPVQYGAYSVMNSLFAIIMLMVLGPIFAVLCYFQWGRKLLEKHPKFFTFGMFSHDGPTREQMDATSFSFTFFGSGYGRQTSKMDPLPAQLDSHIVTKVTGPVGMNVGYIVLPKFCRIKTETIYKMQTAEPGYVATPICMVQAALVVLEEKLPNKGGVLTPAAAFTGTSLIDRLNDSGVKFSVISTTLAE